MARFVCLIAAAVLVGPAWAETPPSVADLVKQLSDAKLASRESAHKELLKRGEGVVPELDRLAKTVDPETANRIGKIRYVLVGYEDDIRRLLGRLQEGPDLAPVPVANQLRRLIAENQPASGDLLLSILARPSDRLYHRALRTFVTNWDVATPDQIDRYIQQAVSFKITHRQKFPAKAGTTISIQAQLRDGRSGWPSINDDYKIDFRTRTTRYLDGKPFDKPTEYRYPFALVSWVEVGELPIGKHTIHAVMEYEFTQRGEKRKGEIRSKESSFEAQSGETPDDLLAPSSMATTMNFLQGFRVEVPDVKVGFTNRFNSSIRNPDPKPQVTWEEVAPGKWVALYCPIWPKWHVHRPLEVDLCFKVEIHDVKTGKIYPAREIRVLRGRTAQGWIVPKDRQAFAAGRDEAVSVKVVFKPSRAVALSEPGVMGYFPNPITSTEMQMKIVPPRRVSVPSK